MLACPSHTASHAAYVLVRPRPSGGVEQHRFARPEKSCRAPFKLAKLIHLPDEQAGAFVCDAVAIRQIVTSFELSALVTPPPYDAVLLVSFGGPEGPDDVLPFLDNVLRGRNVPEQRKLAVAEHYHRFGGVSPINQQNRELIQAIESELIQAGSALPVYWGNRNWHPMLADTLRQMESDGIKRSLAFLTSPFSSYSACRQYLDAIEVARDEVGGGAPRVSKLRAYFNHPRFVAAWCERTRQGLEQFDATCRSRVQVLFTAHSIPTAMADSSPYVSQVTELISLVADSLKLDRSQWQLVFQSRSGPPHQPWLEPDICTAIDTIGKARSTDQVLVVPIGFLSDHIEVLYDLDVEAADAAQRAGIQMVRAKTLGTHPQLVTMARELIDERISNTAARPTLGTMGPAPDECPPDCCHYQPARAPRHSVS